MEDIKKRWIAKKDENFTYALLGLENQTNVHYAMPVRNNLEDAMSYMAQVDEIGKRHRIEKDLSSDEYISNFSKSDKIKPIITLVLYFGGEKWDGPRSLYEMFEVKNQEILKYVSDYKMNIIVPSEIEDMEKFHTDLKQVLEFIKISNEKEKVRELIEKEQKSYESLDNEAVMVLNACIDAKLQINEEGGRTNMCKGIQGLIDDSVQEEHEKMCKGIQGLIDDAKQEGIQEEHERMCKGIQGLIDDAKQEECQEKNERMNEGVQDILNDTKKEKDQEEQKDFIQIKKKLRDLVRDVKIDATAGTILDLYHKGILSEEIAAKELNLTVEEFRQKVNIL